MSNAIEKKNESAQSLEVTELEETMLDLATGGVFSPASLTVNGHCPVTTNSAAGCGVKTSPGVG